MKSVGIFSTVISCSAFKPDLPDFMSRDGRNVTRINEIELRELKYIALEFSYKIELDCKFFSRSNNIFVDIQTFKKSIKMK